MNKPFTMTLPLHTSTTFYNAALASVHDKSYGQIAFNASGTIIRILENAGTKDQLIIDLGCGSGILAKELSGRGYKVIGVDISAAMLRIAEQKAPEATFVQSSLFDYPLPPCTMVSAVGEPLCYLFDDERNDQTVWALFQKVYDRLQDCGYFIFDILTTETDKTPQARIVENDEMSLFINISVNKEQNILTREIILFTREGNCYTRNKEVHRQRLFDKEIIETRLRDTGFQVEVINNYNDHPFRQGHIGFICRK